MFRKICLVMIMLLMISACSEEKPVINTLDGTPVETAFAHFPDIPFPTGANLNIKETTALGSGENWVGTIVYTVAFDQTSVFDFYMSEMPKLKWLEIATVRAQISHLTYIRNNRVVKILIVADGSNKTKVTITAIPKGNWNS